MALMPNSKLIYQSRILGILGILEDEYWLLIRDAINAVLEFSI